GEGALSPPARTVVVAPEHATASGCRFGDGVHDVGMRRRACERDAAFAFGHTRQLLPRLAAVGGAVQRGLGPAGEIAPHVPMALPCAGEDDVGIARIEDHLVDAGPLLAGEDALPRLTAIGGLVEAAVAPLAPERTLRRHVHDLG